MLFILALSFAFQGCIDSSVDNPRVTPTLAKATEKPATTTTPSGSGTTTPTEPVTGFKTLGVGDNYSCAIKKIDNSLWCWGQNTSRQLGSGSVEDQSTPLPIEITKTWAQVEGGAQNTCALDMQNKLYCWGINTNGEVGNDTKLPTSNPTLIGTDTWISIALGNNHACAIKSGYTLWCWGANASGQVGDGTFAEKPSQTRIGADSDWLAISANGDHTCGIRHVDVGGGSFNNTLWCWGKNNKGQLGVGIGDTTNRNTLTQVGAATDWNAISTGGEHTCGIRREVAGGGFDNKLYCWGDNSFGQYGDGTTTSATIPTYINIGTTWSSLSLGSTHTCAIKADNTLWCWGNSDYGQMGGGVTAPVATPQQVASSVGVKRVASGASHTCAINNSDKLYCWGLNIQGQLGLGSMINTSSPTNITPLAWKQVDSGAGHTCGILDDVSLGSVIYCGGLNQYGQLGDGTVQSRANLIDKLNFNPPLNPQPTWKQLSTGTNHTCAIRSDAGSTDTLWCWGDNSQLQLGRPGAATYTYWSPAKESSLANDWQYVSAGGQHTCGIRHNVITGANTLWCWGANSSGQLGNVVAGPPTETPQQENTAATNWSTVSAGDQHTCAIKNNTLWCWGDNTYGQIGDNTTNTPVPVPKEVCIDVACTHASDWIKVSVGGQHTCGIRHNVITGANTLWCWGNDSKGQLGNGTGGNTLFPYQESLNNAYWIDVAVGDDHSCAVSQSPNDPSYKTVFCWGNNSAGQTGTSSNPQQTPQAASSYADWQLSSVTGAPMLALGKQTTCGLRTTSGTTKKLYCWGDGSEYQLGDGRGFKSTPELVPLN
ncbi:MAG: hypothetical protein HY272_11660 [Gammaproteobacteria bacterium]|nr:hypothetical protein [Gammaproteobacteria bacterium]